MEACGAPIAHLHLPHQTHKKTLTQTKSISAQSHNNSNNNLVSQIKSLPNRRMFIGLLFLIPTATIQASSSYALDSIAFDPVTEAEREASSTIARRVSEAVELLEKGKELQAKGDFVGALGFFTQELVKNLDLDKLGVAKIKCPGVYLSVDPVREPCRLLGLQVVDDYKDFAFSDYARVGRALALYEVGDRQEAIAEMEDISISLKGYPEVHAALAAALYVDRHAPILAENQFTIATLLDPQYTDLSYVRETKHWPPSLVSSLRNFITLS